jgi:catechol 2,3-dioxygenase-like lactoylglutathione lyase family enzyme
MFDHVSIGVADIARSKQFYDTALKPLGCSRGRVARGRVRIRRGRAWR